MKNIAGSKIRGLSDGDQLKDSSSEDEEEEEELSDQEDYDAVDEDFKKWYVHDRDVNDSYFVLVNCDRRTVKKGEQAFYCYGKRSNAFLILK